MGSSAVRRGSDLVGIHMQSEREKQFEQFCKNLDRDFENGICLRPSKGCVTGAAVQSGENVNLLPSNAKELDRRQSEEILKYIESESKEFQRIALKYRAVLDWAIGQYKSFIE
jgi:hypothetical protein